MTPTKNESLPEFGDYVEIEQKRFGVPNEMYCYKVIGTLESNYWTDVPVHSGKGGVLHDSSESIVAAICCGIMEEKVERFRLKDVKITKRRFPEANLAAAAGGHCLFDLEQFRPAVEALEAAGRTSEVKDGKLHWTLNSKHWDAQRLFEILDKAPTTPPAPQRLAQGEDDRAAAILSDVLGIDAGRIAWGRGEGRTVSLDDALTAVNMALTTQPPHQDRGEVVGVRAQARKIITDTIGFEFGTGTLQQVNDHDMLYLAEAFGRALTEAKQQGPGEAVIVGYDPGQDDREAEDYHVIMAMGRLLAAIAISVKGPEPAGTAWSYHDLPDIVAALQDAAEQVADEMTAWAATKMADRGSSRRDRLMISEWAKRLRNPASFPVKDFDVEGATLTKEETRAIVRKVLAAAPQVEAKRQTGGGGAL